MSRTIFFMTRYLLGILLLGRSQQGEGNGYRLQYSGLEDSKDYIVHGVTKSQTRLSDFHFHFADLSELRKPTFFFLSFYYQTSQLIKNLPAMWETWIQSLG